MVRGMVGILCSLAFIGDNWLKRYCGLGARRKYLPAGKTNNWSCMNGIIRSAPVILAGITLIDAGISGKSHPNCASLSVILNIVFF